MADHPQLSALINDLIDKWCERRALNPLRELLPAWPLGQGLTEDWHMLYEALRGIRSQMSRSLTEEERDTLGEAIVLVGQAIYGTNP